MVRASTLALLIAVAGGLAPARAERADERVGFVPGVGVESTATVGSVIFERFHYAVKSGAVLDEMAHKTVLLTEIYIKAGVPLNQVSSKAKYKACDGSGPCVLDDDGDGFFDRIAANDTATAIKLSKPVHYTIKDTVVPSVSNFRQVISYLGVSSDTIRLSYREFAGDIARPAFTEELTIPLPKTFPAVIAFKDIHMTIIGIDGSGVRYTINP